MGPTIFFVVMGVTVYAAIDALITGSNVWLGVFWPLHTGAKIFAWLAKKDPQLGALLTISQTLDGLQTNLAALAQSKVDLNADLASIKAKVAAIEASLAAAKIVVPPPTTPS